MSFIGGLNPVSLMATAAFGPAGGALAQLATQVLSQVGQQMIQQMGQRMGLPQSAIDMAQGSFTSSMGDVGGTAQNLDEALDSFGREAGANPSEIGDAQRMVNDLISKQAAEAMESDEAKEAKAGGKGGGWLRALARALGQAADKAADRLEQQAKGLDNASPSESAEYSADAQAFGMLMNAINTAIKSVGEALNTVARKQ